MGASWSLTVMWCGSRRSRSCSDGPSSALTRRISGNAMVWLLGEVARLTRLTWRPPSCFHKIHHETRDSAVAHLFDVQFHHGNDGEPLEVYRCPDCGAWHVGRAIPRR